MFDNDDRLRALAAKAQQGELSDEELAEFAQLAKAKQGQRAQRASAVAQWRQTLHSAGITIQDLFSPAEIAAAVPWGGLTQERAEFLQLRQTQAAMAAARVRRTGKGRKPVGSECRQLMRQALQTLGPLTTTELVHAVMAQKSLPASDEKSLRRAVDYILHQDSSGFVATHAPSQWRRWVLAG